MQPGYTQQKAADGVNSDRSGIIRPMTPRPAPLYLTESHMRIMLEDVLSHGDEEACGLLGGLADRVEQVIPIENELHSSSRYRMEPRAQIRAFQAIEDAGFSLVGIYHSHPAGPMGLSSQDLREAAYPEAAYLIWSRQGNDWHCRGFRLEQGRAREIPLVAAPPVGASGEADRR